MRQLLIASGIIAIFIIPWFSLTYPNVANNIAHTIEDLGEQVAAVILSHDPVTIDDLKGTYARSNFFGGPKVRILVVPGHEPNFGGAEYGELKERDLNVELARSLIGFLNNDSHYQVFTTRNEKAWSPEFAAYFKNNWSDIIAWARAHKQSVKELARVGSFKPMNAGVYHNDVPQDVAIRLYGIDKWVNENDIDIAVHIHFNEYPRPEPGLPGKYSGFAIYVPEKQYYNSTTTKALADTIFRRLSRYNPVSNLPIEKSGIVEDQDLIAVGSYNSVDAASMLVEYAYLYEPQILAADIRSVFLKELAYETYIGLTDFFEPGKAEQLSMSFDTLTLPHRWNSRMIGQGDSVMDVFALQSALIIHGDYPPTGWTMNECPRTGRFGPCTKKALKSFQAKHGIDDEADIVGPETLDKLNDLYSRESLRSI